jgi:predicted RNase H-like HicB family nuclease
MRALLFSASECQLLPHAKGFQNMKIKVVVHDAEEGGFWAEVPAIPGCASQGETMDELLRNVHEAIEGCLSSSLRGA